MISSASNMSYMLDTFIMNPAAPRPAATWAARTPLTAQPAAGAASPAAVVVKGVTSWSCNCILQEAIVVQYPRKGTWPWSDRDV